MNFLKNDIFQQQPLVGIEVIILRKPYKMIKKVTTMMWTIHEYSEHTIVLLKCKWEKCRYFQIYYFICDFKWV